jgi:hypothetical protein
LDAQNREYDEAVTTLRPGAPGGSDRWCESIRGFVVFEVPDGTAGLKLRVQGGSNAAGAVFAPS